MKLSGRIGLGAVAVVALAVAWAWLPWRNWRYRGPGQFSDSGLLAYPRFRIRFPELRLNRANTASFTVRGLPTERMSLELYVPGADERNRSELENLSTQIVAEIVEEASSFAPRRVVCSAVGSPSASLDDSRWVLKGGAEEAFWHRACIDRTFSPGREYSLVVSIRPVRPGSPGFALVPTLEGGGIELP